MRHLSLFSGGSGGSEGLHRAGIATAAYCEIDPQARAVIRAHHPDTPIYTDVREVNGTQAVRDHGPIDLVSGGSPCQDLSVAGNRAGLKGDRSSLFYEQIRVWREVQAAQPDRQVTLIWENVVGALSSNQGKDFARVLSAIVGCQVTVPRAKRRGKRVRWSKAGVVHGPAGSAAWRVLDLQHFGPPQRRRRVFVVGAGPGRISPEQVLLEPPRVRRNPAPGQEPRQDVAARAGAGAESESGRSGLTTLSFSENQRAEVTLGTIFDQLSTGGGKPGQGYPAVLAIPIQSDATGRSGENLTPTPDAEGRVRIRPPGLGVGDPGDPSYTLAAGGPQHAVLAFALRGREGGSQAEVSGDAVNALRGADGGSSRDMVLAFHRTQDPINGPVAPALGATTDGMAVCVTGADASEDGTGRGTPIVTGIPEFARCDAAGEGKRLDWETTTQFVQAGVPRRLTPRECERLMGWPDDWTRYGVRDDGTRYELADGARYRICGNGCGAPHLHWIGLQLQSPCR